MSRNNGGLLYVKKLNNSVVVEELLLIKPENEEKGFSGFKCQSSAREKVLKQCREESQGSLITFLLPLGVFFILGNRSFGERLFGVILPDTGKEIIKVPTPRISLKEKSAEDGIKGVSLSMRHQTVIEDTFTMKVHRRLGGLSSGIPKCAQQTFIYGGATACGRMMV